MSSSHLERVRSSIAADLKAALRARDATVTAALRAALGALDNATAIPRPAFPRRAPDQPDTRPSEVPARHVPLEEIRSLLISEADVRAAAASEYTRLQRPEHAARLRNEARVIRDCLRHLPGPAAPPPEPAAPTS